MMLLISVSPFPQAIVALSRTEGCYSFTAYAWRQGAQPNVYYPLIQYPLKTVAKLLNAAWTRFAVYRVCVAKYYVQGTGVWAALVLSGL